MFYEYKLMGGDSNVNAKNSVVRTESRTEQNFCDISRFRTNGGR